MTILVAALVALAVLVWPRRASSLGLPAAGGRPAETDAQQRGRGVSGAPEGSRASRTARWWTRRAASSDDARTLQALDLVAAAVRAGCHPKTALDYATAELGLASDGLILGAGAGAGADAGAGAIGSGEGGALGVASGSRAETQGGVLGDPPKDQRGPPGLLFVSRAWRLSVEAGVPLADAIDVGVELLRADRRAASQLEVALAGPRATIRVLTLLPLAGPLLGAAFGVSPAAWLSSPIAVASVLAGVALMGFGRWWCARLIAGVSRAPDGADPVEIAGTTDLLALVLRGGCGVVDGLEQVAAVSGPQVAADLASVAAAVRWGMPWTQAWGAVGSGWSAVARAVVLADALGVPPSGPLSRAAADQRRDHATGIEIATARLGVRIMLPLGLAFLPAFVLVGLVPLVLALAGELWRG